MLKYLYSVTETMLITVTLLTLIWALMTRTWGKKPVIWMRAGLGLALAVSAAITALRQRVSWNRWLNSFLNVNQETIYATMIIVTSSIILLILLAVFGRKDGAPAGAGGTAACVFAGITEFGLGVYMLPDVIRCPFDFDTMGKGVVSEEWFLRLGGWLLAIVLMGLYARYLYRAAAQIKTRWLLVMVLAAGLLLNDFRIFAIILRYWAANIKRIPWPIRYNREQYPWVTPLSTFASSNILLFSAITAALAALIPIRLFAEHVKVTEPYDNSAQKRRIRFNNRKLRRLAVKTVACLAVFMVAITAVKAYATRTVELSAPEVYTVEGDRILIDLEAVNDGHLHRYEYRTENNIAVRWIVIKKPNSGSYGVGLDACDVCGNAGYYERGGQVVCKRCDVVMNIRTIGFKGGCNPIPLDYTVENGKMVFKLEDIIAGESEFRF